MNWSEVLASSPLAAILRGVTPTEAVVIAEALLNAGFLCVEVPLNSPDPLKSIAAIKSALGARMLVGAGTVLNVADVHAVAAAGGEIIVSPNTDAAVIRASKDAGLISLPGSFTASEAFAAIAAGADALKLYPADAASPAMLKALKDVLPARVPVLPVGGVTAESFAPWLKAGAAGFGLGGALYKPGLNAEAVHANATAIVTAFKQARGW